ncbi:MAG: hypothetical protein ACYC27_18675 [Armatimonadota bacterium]
MTYGIGGKALDTTVQWTSGALINTAASVVVGITSPLCTDYNIHVSNTASGTALTVVLYNAVDGVDYELTRFSVPALTSRCVPVTGFIAGNAGKITLSNDTAFAAGVGATVKVKVVRLA